MEFKISYDFSFIVFFGEIKVDRGDMNFLELGNDCFECVWVEMEGLLGCNIGRWG